jgi:ATP-dependent Clp protease adaptor protein ClpS
MHTSDGVAPGATRKTPESIEWAMPDEQVPPPPVKAPRAPSRDGGQGAVVAERKAQKTKPPALYQVVLLNDDYTPMEFVVMVLQQYFQRDIDTATHIMLKIHHEGRGVCGVYPKDIASTKVELVLAAARRDGHPLQCIMEAA